MLALVTGASSGIGKEIAKVLAAKGYELVLVSRDRQALDKVRKELKRRHTIIVKDISKRGAAQEVFRQVGKRRLDILINNAGFGLYGEFLDNDLERELDMVELNISALTAFAKLAARHMARQKRGMIMNVASTAAFQPGPKMAVYYATKAYVLSFSEAIAKELEPRGITVTALCPGPTHTGFQKAAHIEESSLFKHLSSKGAQEVAEQGIDAMLKGKRVVVVGTKNKVFAFMVRLLPRRLVVWLVDRIQN